LGSASDFTRKASFTPESPGGADWKTGRYPQLVGWRQEMHRCGATLCSTCAGVLLLAETGLLAVRDATIH
jgi:transcriptional regulator GlxA family with amidase domain